MLAEEQILEQLNQAGYRVTQPRRAVIQALLEDGVHASPAEVHARARQHCPTIGLVTVYRTLDLLSDLGFVRRIHTEDGCHGYATVSHGHHHHLICRNCGAIVQFEGCDLTLFLEQVGRDTGYNVEDHLLELIGLCQACQ